MACDDWKLGPIRIKAVSAEIASDYASFAGGADPLTFLTGCAGQVFGYIPTDQQIPEGGYEVDDFVPAFSITGTFQTEIEAKIIQLLGS